MTSLDYTTAANLLNDLFTEAESWIDGNILPSIDPGIIQIADTLFASSTQSYREALLGCGLVRLLNRTINIRLPYVQLGENAFNGRTMDERVINPFLQDQLIPCSKGPYLASFRRIVKFSSETSGGLRDKKGYSALLTYLSALEISDIATTRKLVVYLLHRFVLLRNASNIPLSRVRRMSLEQYQALVGKLLQVQSGGLIPLLLTTALLRTINACFNLEWEIEWQGINVADKATGAGGDVSVKKNGAVELVIEVTERSIEKSRVVSTFNTKIVRAGIEDYLFLYTSAPPSEEARQSARSYFSQGHEIIFLQLQDWIINNLGVIGWKCRGIFMNEVLSLLETRDVPVSVKMAWNELLKEIVGS